MFIFLILAVVVEFVVICGLSYGLLNILRKYEVMESWVIAATARIAQAIETMRALDLRGTFAGKPLENGAFESDDEVGAVFDDLKGVVYSLSKLIANDLNDK